MNTDVSCVAELKKRMKLQAWELVRMQDKRFYKAMKLELPAKPGLKRELLAANARIFYEIVEKTGWPVWKRITIERWKKLQK